MVSHTSPQQRCGLALDLDALAKQEEEEEVDVQQLMPPHEWSAGFVVTYGAFFFSGASAIAMWSCITLCLDFFAQKYPTERVGFVFPVVNMSTLLVISLYMIVAGRQLPLETRMHGSLAAYLVLVLLLPLANILEMPTVVAYTLTIMSLVGSTICSSVMQSTMYGLGGVFGPVFLQAIEGGKGFGAILLFVIRLALKWHFRSHDEGADGSGAAQELYYAKLSMAVFFGVAFVIVATTWTLYTGMKYAEFAEPMLEEYLMVQDETPINATLLLSTPLPSPTGSEPQFPTEQSPLLSNNVVWPREQIQRNEDAQAQAESEEEGLLLLREHATSATLVNVLRTAAKPFFSLFLSFFVCLSCFPGLISAIPSTTYHLADWFPIVLVGCYNLGDLVGKNLPVYVMYFDVESLHLPWLLQVSFIPFFMAALVHPFADLVTIVAVVFLGLVTGYVATASMILAPSVCSEYQKEVAGMVGGLSAILGLCIGSYNGLALEMLIQLWTKT
uniref:Equilibrative nucleoside transporter n=1 Tax=Globisporangium ultimum (strain ATCC 200006 / CBS 805.95 / DAOM BR144) TaxID=431595 RepID=K3X8P9_GLOUD